MGNSVHVITIKENKMSVCYLGPKSSCIPFDVFSRVPLLHRRIHNCAITSFLLSVPPVKLFLIFSVTPVPWSPVCCQQVPVLSGCLHILSFNWNTTYFSSVTISCLHFPPSETVLYNLYFNLLLFSRIFTVTECRQYQGDSALQYRGIIVSKSTKVFCQTVDNNIHFL